MNMDQRSDKVGITIETYDKIVDYYVRTHQHFDFWDEEYKQFGRIAKRAGKMLDVGCGPGFDEEYFSPKGFEVTGIDLSEKMLIEAERRSPKSTFIKMDIRKLAFPDSSFDYLWCCASILHVPRGEIGETLKGFARVLKGNGIMFLATKKGTGEDMRSYPDGSERYFVYYQRVELEDLLHESGFDILESHEKVESNKDTWLVFFCKKKG